MSSGDDWPTPYNLQKVVGATPHTPDPAQFRRNFGDGNSPPGEGTSPIPTYSLHNVVAGTAMQPGVAPDEGVGPKAYTAPPPPPPPSADAYRNIFTATARTPEHRQPTMRSGGGADAHDTGASPIIGRLSAMAGGRTGTAGTTTASGQSPSVYGTAYYGGSLLRSGQSPSATTPKASGSFGRDANTPIANSLFQKFQQVFSAEKGSPPPRSTAAGAHAPPTLSPPVRQDSASSVKFADSVPHSERRSSSVLSGGARGGAGRISPNAPYDGDDGVAATTTTHTRTYVESAKDIAPDSYSRRGSAPVSPSLSARAGYLPAPARGYAPSGGGTHSPPMPDVLPAVPRPSLEHAIPSSHIRMAPMYRQRGMDAALDDESVSEGEGEEDTAPLPPMVDDNMPVVPPEMQAHYNMNQFAWQTHPSSAIVLALLARRGVVPHMLPELVEYHMAEAFLNNISLMRQGAYMVRYPMKHGTPKERYFSIQLLEGKHGQVMPYIVWHMHRDAVQILAKVPLEHLVGVTTDHNTRAFRRHLISHDIIKGAYVGSHRSRLSTKGCFTLWFLDRKTQEPRSIDMVGLSKDAYILWTTTARGIISVNSVCPHPDAADRVSDLTKLFVMAQQQIGRDDYSPRRFNE